MFGAYAQFASTESGASSDILLTLGIDWKLLLLQTIAFLLLLFLLTKFVFPVIGAMLEKREKLIEDSVKAAHEAEAAAKEASADTARLMKQARKDADDVLASAKAEAADMVEKAEKKSRERSERIVAAAEEEIAKNVAAAKKSLRDETLSLVADATEKVVGNVVTQSVDKKVVAEAVKEAEK